VDHDDDFEHLPRRIAQISIKEENILEEGQEGVPAPPSPPPSPALPLPEDLISLTPSPSRRTRYATSPSRSTKCPHPPLLSMQQRSIADTVHNVLSLMQATDHAAFLALQLAATKAIRGTGDNAPLFIDIPGIARREEFTENMGIGCRIDQEHCNDDMQQPFVWAEEAVGGTLAARAAALHPQARP
jgi:hypothetical protein